MTSGVHPLSFLVGSLIPVFEPLLVIVVVAATVAGGLLRPSPCTVFGDPLNNDRSRLT